VNVKIYIHDNFPNINFRTPSNFQTLTETSKQDMPNPQTFPSHFEFIWKLPMFLMLNPGNRITFDGELKQHFRSFQEHFQVLISGSRN
jgi:hypothetical protein